MGPNSSRTRISNFLTFHKTQRKILVFLIHHHSSLPLFFLLLHVHILKTNPRWLLSSPFIFPHFFEFFPEISSEFFQWKRPQTMSSMEEASDCLLDIDFALQMRSWSATTWRGRSLICHFLLLSFLSSMSSSQIHGAYQVTSIFKILMPKFLFQGDRIQVSHWFQFLGYQIDNLWYRRLIMWIDGILCCLLFRGFERKEVLFQQTEEFLEKEGWVWDMEVHWQREVHFKPRDQPGAWAEEIFGFFWVKVFWENKSNSVGHAWISIGSLCICNNSQLSTGTDKIDHGLDLIVNYHNYPFFKELISIELWVLFCFVLVLDQKKNSF